MKRLMMMAVLLFVTASASQAQIKFGPRAGVNVNNGGDYFVGGQAEISLPVLPLTFVPNAEYYFVKDVTTVNSNLDVQYTFIGVGVAKLVAGGGYTFGYAKAKGIDAAKDSGLNLQFGAKASLGLNVTGLVRTTKIGDGDWTHSLVVAVTF